MMRGTRARIRLGDAGYLFGGFFIMMRAFAVKMLGGPESSCRQSAYYKDLRTVCRRCASQTLRQGRMRMLLGDMYPERCESRAEAHTYTQYRHY